MKLETGQKTDIQTDIKKILRKPMIRYISGLFGLIINLSIINLFLFRYIFFNRKNLVLFLNLII